MKSILTAIVITAFFMINVGTIAIAGDGPAPNSGDGVSDGSGFSDKGRDDDLHGAPNSGDGIPDGSGFEKGDEGNGASGAGNGAGGAGNGAGGVR